MNVDLAALTKDQFEAHRGTTFVMRVGVEETVTVELVSTESLPTPKDAKRGSFLVRFRAAEKRVLPQQIYALEHPVLGTMEIFLVPAGPDAVGMRYDAVFS